MGLFNKMTFWDALQLLDCEYLSPHLKKKIIKAESNFTEEEKTACYIMYSLHKGDCGLALSFINRAEHGEELIPEIMMALFTHVAVRTFRAAYEKEPSNPDYIAFFAFAYEIGFYDCEKDHAKAVEFADLLRFTDTDGVLVKYALKKIFPEETHNGSTADDNDRKNATANTDPTSTAVPTSAKDPSDKSAPQAEFKRVEYDGGDVYEGEILNGKRHGKGKYTWSDGSFYEGEWKDDRKDGNGKQSHPDGSCYDGGWKDDKMDGFGVLVYSNQSRYEGHWSEGYENGHGMLTFANGNSYDGEWVNGEMNGNGIYTYANGEKYKVTCKEDEIISKEPFETPKTSSTVIRSNQKAKTEYKQIRYDGGDVGEKSMSICDELKKQAEQTYAEGIDKSIETAAACFRLCAEGLSRFPDDGGGSYPIQDISLLIACSAVSGGWNRTGSADRDRMSERLKLYVSNVNELCDDLPLALTVPGFANIGRNLMSSPQISAFTEHLTRLFQTLDEHEKMAVVTMHYLMLYAVFERWPQVDVLKDTYENASVQSEDTYEPPESNSAGIPFSHTYAAPAQPTAAAIARYERNAQRRWRPLKIYLIVTGLFIALVLGLYFYAAPPFSEGQEIVVKDITGQSVKMLPDSEPVELALVGLTDYNGVVRLFYGMITGIVVYRIVSIIAVFIINLLYRRRNAKKAALRAGNYIP